MGEHGPHAIMVGPDGRLYYNSGNHSHLKAPIDPASPLNVMYEGELLPHMNDSRGHAAGIMAPGGEIYRSDDMGKTWKRIVGGYRNQYDFAFNSKAELFTFDSDMEWDIGVPWYRPVRVNHSPIGGELGWRNGSADWPEYYFDSLPATVDLGRGSPTGVTFYQGSQFPEEYRDRFFICDWSQGRILAVDLKPEGSSFRGRAKEMVTGQPLNCTDIEAGPDGCVYFSTGGRGTQGGLFRLKSTATASPKPAPADWLAAALDVESPLSSFARKQVEAIPVPALLPLLGEPDRFLRSAARTAIEHAGPGRFRDALLAVDGPRAKLDAMLALARATTLDQAAQDDLFDRELVLLRETLDPALQL
ncbi:MAG: hypothetical protein J0I50_11255, partial [Microbacterium sp.]|nr:hypothetical protein [Microbacterium sp.]